VRNRRFWWLVAAAVAFALFSAAWIATHPGHNRSAVALDDVSETVAPLAAAVVCFLAAARRQTAGRVAWGLIGLSALSWGAGQADWACREVILGQGEQSLFPSWPDVGYLIAIPTGVAGLIALPAFRGAGTRISLLFDGLVMVGGALFISWATILGPIYASSSAGMMQQALSLTYPLGDVFMGTIVILALSRMVGRGRQPFVFLGLGVLLNTVADSTFAYLTTVQNFDTSNPADVGWTLGYCFIALGALRAMTVLSGSERPVQQTRWRMALPYLPMLAAGLVVAADEVRGVSLDAFLLWDSMGIVAVVLARQFMLVRDSRVLGVQLQRQNRLLDRLVEERTRELDQTLDGLREANERRKELLLRLVTLQDEERRRLSGIIHDDMLQWMTVGLTRLQLARRGIADPKLSGSLDRAGDAVQVSIARMRVLMSELHPQVVERGFTVALRQYLEQVEREGDLRCALDGGFADEPSGTVATTLYRVICEAVVNARKHAIGSTVTVELRDARAGYAVSVADDGPGFVPEGTGWSPTGHVGLSSMRERTEALGGSWSLVSHPGEGTRVEFWVPSEPAASAPAVRPSISDAELAAAVADLEGKVPSLPVPVASVMQLPASPAGAALGIGASAQVRPRAHLAA
jgi:signal transduction histidine kinase